MLGIVAIAVDAGAVFLTSQKEQAAADFPIPTNLSEGRRLSHLGDAPNTTAILRTDRFFVPNIAAPVGRNSVSWPPWKKPDKPVREGEPPEKLLLTAIGFVRNDVLRPHPKGWSKTKSSIEILPEHQLRLEGLERFSHVIVVVYLDLAPGAPEQPETITLPSGNEYGVLATRSQLRPNHLGVSAVQLLDIKGKDVSVRGLDAIDGTPVLDIKPYLPEYDSIPDAQVPPS